MAFGIKMNRESALSSLPIHQHLKQNIIPQAGSKSRTAEHNLICDVEASPTNVIATVLNRQRLSGTHLIHLTKTLDLGGTALSDSVINDIPCIAGPRNVKVILGPFLAEEDRSPVVAVWRCYSLRLKISNLDHDQHQ